MQHAPTSDPFSSKTTAEDPLLIACRNYASRLIGNLTQLTSELQYVKGLYNESQRRIDSLELQKHELSKRLEQRTSYEQFIDHINNPVIIVVIVVLAVLVLGFLITSSIAMFICGRRQSKPKKDGTPSVPEVVTKGEPKKPQKTPQLTPTPVPEKPPKKKKSSAKKKPKNEPGAQVSPVANTAQQEQQKEDDDKTDLSDKPLFGGDNPGSLDLESQPDKTVPENSQPQRVNPLAPDYIPPEKFVHKGPLVIPKNQKIVLEHDLENQSEPVVKSTEHFEFDDKLNVVYDIGSEVEILKSSTSKKRQASGKSKGHTGNSAASGQPKQSLSIVTADSDKNKENHQPDPDKKSVASKKKKTASPAAATTSSGKSGQRKSKANDASEPVAIDPVAIPRKKASDDSSGPAKERKKAKDPAVKSGEENTLPRSGNKSPRDNTDDSAKLLFVARKKPSDGAESTR